MTTTDPLAASCHALETTHAMLTMVDGIGVQPAEKNKINKQYKPLKVIQEMDQVKQNVCQQSTRKSNNVC